MIPTVEMIEAGWKAGLGLNKLQVERILRAALAVAAENEAKVCSLVAQLREELIVEAFAGGVISDGKLADRLIRERAAAADAISTLLAALAEANSVHRWNVDDDGNGSLMVCRHNHGKNEPCEWERFVPAPAHIIAEGATP